MYHLRFLRRTSLEFSMFLDVVRLMGLRRLRRVSHLRKHGPDTRQLTLTPMKNRIGRAHTSLLGHSYGSMTAGKVAKMIRKGVLDDLVMYGSPGAGAHDAREYNLDHGRPYVSGIKSDDAVKGKGTLNSKFGNNPMFMSGVKHLANNSERDRLFFIPWKMFDRHSEYLEEGTSSLEDISRVVTNVPVKGEK